MFAVSIPNFATSSALVDTATKCLATASSLPRPFTIQSRAVRAFVMVSIVVNVFDEITNSVDSGSRPSVASRKSAASAFDTKCAVRPGWAKSRSGFVRPSSGPRSDPPMPMLTTARIGLPGVPGPLAGADPVGERRHPVEHLVHRGNDVDAVGHQLFVARCP